MSAVSQNFFYSPTSFYGRLGVFWRATLSPRARYEIGSVITIIGLILTLAGAASIHAVTVGSVATSTILSVCAALSIHPLATAIVSVLVGLILLFGGIFLLPVQQKLTTPPIPYLTISP
ncbi:hypothetical protein [Chlamydia sp.]|uniref:hypothetical protein n=1 Tax=Chlamydia sp. TaxID=35827 RepID=UPI0025C3A1B2|nr:hypothetical protein [Chlamydia sp.]MBQ8498617.1 hypothetical protein [Chlamydia sp.]